MKSSIRCQQANGIRVPALPASGSPHACRSQPHTYVMQTAQPWASTGVMFKLMLGRFYLIYQAGITERCEQIESQFLKSQNMPNLCSISQV
jgi:hypothetical protein